MLTEKSFDTGEIVINFAEGEAAGPPLVMLHGSSLNWQSFGEFIPTLEQSWHIYACDLRGHGKSGRAKSGRSCQGCWSRGYLGNPGQAALKQVTRFLNSL